MSDGEFREGDVVFVHGTAGDGLEGVLLEVDAARSRTRAEVSYADGGRMELEFGFEDLVLEKPARREPDEDFARAVRAATRPAARLELSAWWAEKAREIGKRALTDEELLAFAREGDATEAAVEAEARERSETALVEIAARTDGRDRADKMAIWRAEHARWTDWHSDLRRRQRAWAVRMLGEEQVVRLERASAAPGDEDAAARAVDEAVGKLLERGIALRNRCVYAARRHAAPRLRYEDAPARAVDFAAPLPPSVGRRGAPSIVPGPVSGARSVAVEPAPIESDAEIATLLERYESARREGESSASERDEIAVRLLASDRPDAVRAVIATLTTELPGGGAALEGFVARGRRAIVPFAANPWKLPPECTLPEAIASVWARLRDRAPRFIAAIESTVVGLALLRPADPSESPMLAYLYLRAGPGREAGAGPVLTLFVGRAPRDPNDDRVPDLENFRLPLALRELYAAHTGLEAGPRAILGPEALFRLSLLCAERAEEFQSVNTGALPSQYVVFTSAEKQNAELFDLDRLDGRGDPLVCTWEAETWEVHGGADFWTWFEDDIAPEFLPTT